MTFKICLDMESESGCLQEINFGVKGLNVKSVVSSPDYSTR